MRKPPRTTGRPYGRTWHPAWFYVLAAAFVAFCVLYLTFCDSCGGKP